ncbi:transposable element Tcb1 transposase [Trichonephila clavipes]|nr:transposable element Tcb1 transposase [Trichonephila clavipes]
MVWGAIAYKTRSPLVLIHATMTIQWYVHDILQPYVFPFYKTVPRSHFSTRQCCASYGKGVKRLSLHCYYPTLACPISRFVSNRAYLGRRVGHSMSLNEVEARWQQILNEISQDIIQNLYVSMLDCIASCIRASEGSTGY